MLPLPACMTITSNSLTISPSQCAGTYSIRLDGWISDSTLGLNTHANFTTFRVTVLPNNFDCRGTLKLMLNNNQKLT